MFPHDTFPGNLDHVVRYRPAVRYRFAMGAVTSVDRPVGQLGPRVGTDVATNR